MSQFLNSETRDDSLKYEIDFNDAKELPTGGSTCHLYRTRWQRHDVFVKKLKPEFATNPLYLDALDKEYEIGVSLKHPSLPDYRSFHRDYIVMDYIDGVTLADMVKQKDNWLSNKKNVTRILKELIEVVDYLHRHNVIHCDIKPDNILITSNTHHLVLIDFDKCYTDSFNDTSGDPSKFGLSYSNSGETALDYLGIAKIAQLLKENIPGFRFHKFRKFIKECRSENPDAQILLSILNKDTEKPAAKNILILIGTGILLLSIFFLIFYFFLLSKESNEKTSAIILPEITMDSVTTQKPEIIKEPLIIPEVKTSPQTTLRTDEEIHEEAQKRAEIYDKISVSYYTYLEKSFNRLTEMKDSGNFSIEQILDSLRNFSNFEEEYLQESIEKLYDLYPDMSERELWRTLGLSKSYTGYKRRVEKKKIELGKWIEQGLPQVTSMQAEAD